MPRPIQATIHTAHLSHNLQVLKNKAPNSRLWATVKANAYGHGIRHVYEALRAADGFAVLDLDEVMADAQLRQQVLLRESYHVATLDNDADLINASVRSFFKQAL